MAKEEGEPSTSSEEENRPVFYCAPMVRYSKLAFRLLVRKYCAAVAFSPMIYAANFLESEFCRQAEFSTNDDDRPLIVQFASDDPVIFASAAEMVYPQSNGVDLNCGCPKRDVRAKGFGSKLLAHPELLADIVRHTRARISDPDYSISLKIRIEHPLERSVDLCRKAEAAGVSFLTVHGRTPAQRGEPVDLDAIRLIASSVGVPVVANGDVKTKEQALRVAEYTGAKGVMVANGLLENPALFAGYSYTPIECIKDWLDISADVGTSFEHFHQHLVFMLRAQLTPPQRRIFHELTSRPAIEDFLDDIFGESLKK